MTDSVLVKVPVRFDGMLLDDEDSFVVGEIEPVTGRGVLGLHNVSLSYAHPGCLWLSLQFANQLLLVDGNTMEVMQIIAVPTTMDVDGKCKLQ
jgi:hypothetical protein